MTDKRQNGSKALLVYHRGNTVGACKKTAIDNAVKRVAKRAGIERDISNHTLRRTCARMWYRAGVPIATISSLLGHSDTKTTVKYLLVLDDFSNGAQLFDAYFAAASVENIDAVESQQKTSKPDRESGLGGT